MSQVAGPRAEIGVFGGTGFYRFLEGVEEVAVQTPFGPPSARVAVGEVEGRRVAFLARHGAYHEHPAHRVNYRANLWALRKLGVRRVLGPCSVGSLQPAIHPGEIVVCDQLVDRTRARVDTFFDGPLVNSIAFADPYCPELRAVAVAAAADSLERTPTGPPAFCVDFCTYQVHKSTRNAGVLREAVTPGRGPGRRSRRGQWGWRGWPPAARAARARRSRPAPPSPCPW